MIHGLQHRSGDECAFDTATNATRNAIYFGVTDFISASVRMLFIIGIRVVRVLATYDIISKIEINMKIIVIISFECF